MGQIPFNIISRCPIEACSNSSKYFLTLLEVNPSHILCYPLLIAMIHVAITKKHVCRYNMKAGTQEILYELADVCCSTVNKIRCTAFLYSAL